MAQALKASTISPALIAELFSYNPRTGVIRYKKAVHGKYPKKVGDVAGKINTFGYRVLSIKRILVYCHHLAWCLHHGRWPKGKLDHKDRNRSNNRIKNLRPERRGNQQNRSVSLNNTSGSTGVSFHKASGRWRAFVYVGNKQKSLGYHPTKEEAVSAYAEGKKKYHKFNPKVVTAKVAYPSSTTYRTRTA